MKIKPLHLTLAGLLVAVSAWGFTYITDKRTSGTPLPIKWPPGSIAMRVMVDNSTMLTDGTTRATAIVAAMQDAQRGWNQYLGDAQFSPQILPAGSGTDGNSINEVFFSNSPYGKSWESNTLAITTVWSISDQRSESDTIFNTAFKWDSYRGPLRSGVEDIQRVALHEFGHNLGLDHPDQATPPQIVSAIMNHAVTDIDSLQADDITGAQNLYGPPGVPANDNFANATIITLTNNTATVTGYNTNATKETGEPNHAANIGGRSVWWKWMAPAAGPVTVDTIGSYFDTTLGVYTGSAVNNLTTIGSNDDISDPPQPHIQASKVTFTATAGTTYYFAVDGFNDATSGNGADSAGITLNITHTPTGPTIPVITTQPVSATVTAGGTASFTVVATGATGYQWQFNGANISGATSATYTISNAQAANGGTYSVIVSNGAGSVTSNNAALTVNTPSPPPPMTGGGGGGGGGAPSLWFYGALSLLAACRFLRHRHALGA